MRWRWKVKLHSVDDMQRAWPQAVSVSGASEDPESYGGWRSRRGHALTASQVGLFGKDAVVASLKHGKCRLDIYGSSAWPYLDLQGVWLLPRSERSAE